MVSAVYIVCVVIGFLVSAVLVWATVTTAIKVSETAGTPFTTIVETDSLMKQLDHYRQQKRRIYVCTKLPDGFWLISGC